MAELLFYDDSSISSYPLRKQSQFKEDIINYHPWMCDHIELIDI